MADYTSARSIVDETFLRLFRSVAKLDITAGSESAFANWLGDSLVRAIVGRLIQQQADGNSSAECATPTTVITETTIWAEAPASEETAFYRDLMIRLVSLPSNLRIVYNLRVIDGYSAEETARLLQIEEKEADRFLSEARSLLRSTALPFHKI
jgi:RNA polymerase sigma-70 factor (ECF subfamily)